MKKNDLSRFDIFNDNEGVLFPQIPLPRSHLPVGLNMIYPPNLLVNTFSAFQFHLRESRRRLPVLSWNSPAADIWPACSREGSRGAPPPLWEAMSCRISDSDGINLTLHHWKSNSVAFSVTTLAFQLISVHFDGHQNPSNSPERHQVVGECLLFLKPKVPFPGFLYVDGYKVKLIKVLKVVKTKTDPGKQPENWTQ